jgi:hypothetical protein
MVKEEFEDTKGVIRRNTPIKTHSKTNGFGKEFVFAAQCMTIAMYLVLIQKPRWTMQITH